MCFYVTLLWVYFKQYMKTRLAYRGDFLSELLADLSFQLLNLIFILVVFTHTPTIRNLNREEILFIYGYYLIPFAIFTTFFNLWHFNERYIIRGEMDRVLTRPAHSLYQVILETMDPQSLFGAVTGLILIFYSANKLDLHFGVLDLLMFVLLVLDSVLVYGGIFVAITAIGFFSDSNTGITPMMWNIQQYGRYPVDIYNKAIRYILTFVLPFGFVGVYPASFFLRREEWALYAWLTPVVGLAVFLLWLAVWNFGVRWYRGAGS